MHASSVLQTISCDEWTKSLPPEAETRTIAVYSTPAILTFTFLSILTLSPMVSVRQ